MDLKDILFVVNGRQSAASTVVTKQLNQDRPDPVYTDSAKKPDLAKGCLEKMLFLHAMSVFVMRHQTCWNQLESQKMLTVILLSDLC